MITVGVRDLKNQLSQYLQQVKMGEKVLITEHNKVIAEISLPVTNAGGSKIEEKLELLSASGRLIKAKRNASIKIEPEFAAEIDWIQEYTESRKG